MRNRIGIDGKYISLIFTLYFPHGNKFYEFKKKRYLSNIKPVFPFEKNLNGSLVLPHP